MNRPQNASTRSVYATAHSRARNRTTFWLIVAVAAVLFGDSGELAASDSTYGSYGIGVSVGLTGSDKTRTGFEDLALGIGIGADWQPTRSTDLFAGCFLSNREKLSRKKERDGSHSWDCTATASYLFGGPGRFLIGPYLGGCWSGWGSNRSDTGPESKSDAAICGGLEAKLAFERQGFVVRIGTAEFETYAGESDERFDVRRNEIWIRWMVGPLFIFDLRQTFNSDWDDATAYVLYGIRF